MQTLTSAAHTRIRWQLVLLPSYVWLVYDWMNLLVTLPRLVPLRDFVHFYVLGVIARERNLQALYDMDLMAAMVPRVVPGAPITVFPPAYGPQLSIFFSPLTWFDYKTALYSWFVLSFLVYAICCYAIWRVCPRLRDLRWTTAVLLLAAPALHFALGWSQISAIGLVCVTGAFLALRADRLFLAGVAIGSLAYKPQLGLAAAFVFIAAREWRIVLGAMTAASVQLGVGCVYWGPSVLVRNIEALLWYVGALHRVPVEPYKYHMHSWRSFFELLGLPADVALVAYLVTSAVTLIVALRCWRMHGPLALRYSALILASVLIDPHLYAYDLVLLTPVLMVLWDWVLGQRDRATGEFLPAVPTCALRRLLFKPLFQWMLYFTYFSPLLFGLTIITRVQMSVPAFALLELAIAGVLAQLTGTAANRSRELKMPLTAR